MIRDAKANPDGLRIPAPDLEKIVIQTMAPRLRNGQWLSSIFDLHADISGFGRLVDAANVLAAEIEQQSTRTTGILHKIVRRIEVSKKRIKVSIDLGALHQYFVPAVGCPLPTAPVEHIFDLVIAGRFLRCGKQVRPISSPDGLAALPISPGARCAMQRMSTAESRWRCPPPISSS